MNSIDLSPLYRSSVGYDRIGALIDSAVRGGDHSAGYPPYNIEVLDENRYAICLAIAGFKREDLELSVENSVLTIRGSKPSESTGREYLHQGIANRAFERRFNLAEHVEVTDADLKNGLLTVSLIREIPEAMKPRTIPIGSDEGNVLEHKEKPTTKRGGAKQAA